MSADRNLLFGILALQMDFIARDALIAAMNAWVLEKAKPLGQILLEQGTLQPEDRALLDTMVRRHLELHGNDAEKSLAALSSIGSVRKELEQVGDPEVQASLVHVSAARPDGEDPYATRASSVGEPTAAGLRFRILRPHAKGGLGQVSVARDEELHREVALKEIQDRFADDPGSRARFVREAQLTGGLEHPGIVPVYGLGQYLDGRPFYAMRFIRGETFKEAIARFHKDTPADPGARTLALQKLLRRFLDVCNAVAYAHGRRVLHRDIKPGNVMLGDYGETLVVDWGLAKATDWPIETSSTQDVPLRPPAATAAMLTEVGQAVGTIEYMSPEQAAGQLDEMGPASDVYSLGATLYVLLTNQPPFDRKDNEVMQKVQRGEFPRPRQVKPHVPAALEAICLKAMARKPKDRYASALELAGELENWLADEPVAAYPEPLRIRLLRWARRRPLTSAGIGLLGAIDLALAVGSVGREFQNDYLYDLRLGVLTSIIVLIAIVALGAQLAALAGLLIGLYMGAARSGLKGGAKQRAIKSSIFGAKIGSLLGAVLGYVFAWLLLELDSSYGLFFGHKSSVAQVVALLGPLVGAGLAMIPKSSRAKLFRRAVLGALVGAILCSNLAIIYYRYDDFQERRAKRKSYYAKEAQERYKLGNLLYTQKRLEEAWVQYQQAFQLDHTFVAVHNELGHILLAQGQLEGAKLEFGQLSRDDATEQIRRCDRLLALAQRLPAVLRGDDRPTSAAEQLEFADLCQQPFEGRYTLAARLYTDAFAAESNLADDINSGHRYNAACAAVLAARGQGLDAAHLDDREKARLRGQALGWLRADLSLWSRVGSGGKPPVGRTLRESLQNWQDDTDLLGVRHPLPLANLPQAEREAWHKLWYDVGDLIAKAAASNSEPKRE
jgi:serine/threonine protein kinase